jgi:hypothetical protein
MAPVGQAATHQGFSQWKQGMNTYEARGRPLTILGATWITWQGLGPTGRALLLLQTISQEWHPMQFLMSWNR